MEQAEEAAAEAEAERRRGLHFVGKARVVEPQPADRGAQVLEIGGVDREQAAEHHRLRRLEAGQRRRGRPPVVGDGVADAGVGDLLDLRGDEADLAGAEFGRVGHLRAEHADAVDFIMRVGAHHADAQALADDAVDDPHQHDDAEIGVVPAIDQQRLQRRRLVALGRRQAVDDRLQHEVDVEAGLGRNRHRLGRVEADHVLDLLPDAIGLGGGQVDLVEHRHDLMAGVERVIDVGEGLRLDPLARVDHQQRTLAGGQRTGDLIGEVDMAGRVHQIEHVGAPVLGDIVEPHRLRLDRDAALALDIHGIKHLLDHFALGHRSCLLDQPVGERRLAMVDMRDDGEIADVVDRMRGHVG